MKKETQHLTIEVDGQQVFELAFPIDKSIEVKIDGQVKYSDSGPIKTADGTEQFRFLMSPLDPEVPISWWRLKKLKKAEKKARRAMKLVQELVQDAVFLAKDWREEQREKK